VRLAAQHPLGIGCRQWALDWADPSGTGGVEHGGTLERTCETGSDQMRSNHFNSIYLVKDVHIILEMIMEIIV
jgi:hypothetical protein